MATTADTSTKSTTAGIADQAAPHIEKARTFVKQNKWASAAAAGVIGLALLNTLPMVVLGTLFAIIIGTLTGVIAAWRRGTPTEALTVTSALGFYSMPPQWLGLVIVLFIAGWVGLPTAGVKDPTLGILDDPGVIEVLVDRLEHMILPALTLGHTVTPSPTNQLGVKGVGEAGTIGAAPAVINAVVDALKDLGVTDVAMPASPLNVWKAIHQRTETPSDTAGTAVGDHPGVTARTTTAGPEDEGTES